MTKEAFGKIRDGLEEAIAAIRDEEFFDQLFQRVIESGTGTRAAVLPPRPRYRQGHEEATNGDGND